MWALGLPSVLCGALMIAWWFGGRSQLADASLDPNLGAWLGIVFGALATAAAGVAFVMGLVYRSSAPSEEASKRAELAEFAASQTVGLAAPTPPMPGAMPWMQGATPPMPPPPATPA